MLDINNHYNQLASINYRPKSPSRSDAFDKAIKPGPIYSSNVLLGNWIEDRIECPEEGTFYFPPKEAIDCEKMTPYSRHNAARNNKVSGIKGRMKAVLTHDNYTKPNYATTYDLVYHHLPKPLYGPNPRYYRRSKHLYYPQPDLLQCYGNITEWGLRKYKESMWPCADNYDEMPTQYEVTYVRPNKEDYTAPSERRGKDVSFTKTFPFKMTKSKK